MPLPLLEPLDPSRAHNDPFLYNKMSFVRSVKLRVPAGAAKPGPSIGQALGPLGINMAQFCKDFNEKSDTLYKKDTPVTVQLNAMSDRTYTFDIRSPPTAWLIKQAIGMDKGPSSPNASINPVGTISPQAVYEIAKIKQQDDNRWHLPLEGIAHSVIGTARSMGVVVEAYASETQEEEEEEKESL